MKAADWILTLEDDEQSGLTLAEIMAAVSKVTRVGKLDMMSTHRAAHIAEARQISQWFARTYTSRSYPEIGRFCKRDHATVVHGFRKIDARKSDLRPKLDAVAKELGVEIERMREAA